MWITLSLSGCSVTACAERGAPAVEPRTSRSICVLPSAGSLHRFANLIWRDARGSIHQGCHGAFTGAPVGKPCARLDVTTQAGGIPGQSYVVVFGFRSGGRFTGRDQPMQQNLLRLRLLSPGFSSAGIHAGFGPCGRAHRYCLPVCASCRQHVPICERIDPELDGQFGQ